MNKKFQLAIGFLVISMVVLACESSDKIQVNTPGESNNNNQSAATSTSQLGSTRSNPAPAGSEVVFDDMAFQIMNTVRPADSLVATGNMFNSTPEPDQEYMFVEVQVTCKKTGDEKCSFSPEFSTKLTGSNGVEYNPEIMLSGVEKLLETTEFYGGAVISGYVPFIVKKDETNFVLVYDPILGDKFYLAIP